MIAVFWASLTAPDVQCGVLEFWLHRKTVIWSLLPQ
jgi:hypothetical protein